MADADRAALDATRKRSSPAADDEDGLRTGNGPMRSESLMELDRSLPKSGERQRTASPEMAIDKGAVLDRHTLSDGSQTRRGSFVDEFISPLNEDARTSVVKAVSSPLADTIMDDAYPPATNDGAGSTKYTRGENGARLETRVSISPRSTNATVDSMMGGMDGSDRPSVGEKKPPTKVEPQSPFLSGIKLRPAQKMKRLREQHEKELEKVEQRSSPPIASSEFDQARQGLRLALVLALDHVGFSSATSDALESFLFMTETCTWPVFETFAVLASVPCHTTDNLQTFSPLLRTSPDLLVLADATSQYHPISA